MIRARTTVRLNKMPKLKGELHQRAAIGVEDAAEKCAGLARSLAPVDRGAMVASIETEKETDLRRKVIAKARAKSDGAPYPIFIEFGTRHSAAQPFLIPAAEMVKPGFIEDMSGIAEEAAAA